MWVHLAQVRQDIFVGYEVLPVCALVARMTAVLYSLRSQAPVRCEAMGAMSFFQSSKGRNLQAHRMHFEVAVGPHARGAKSEKALRRSATLFLGFGGVFPRGLFSPLRSSSSSSCSSVLLGTASMLFIRWLRAEVSVLYFDSRVLTLARSRLLGFHLLSVPL